MGEPSQVPGMAPTAQPTETQLTVADAAEARYKELLSKEFPEIDYNTGRHKPKGLFKVQFRRMQNRADCMLLGALEVARDPLTTSTAEIEDIYTYEQRFAVMQPLVSVTDSAAALPAGP
jgi:hypothetical protein